MTAATFSRSNIASEPKPYLAGTVLNARPWATEVLTTWIDEANDTINMGYLPAGVTLVGFLCFSDDLDTATGLVWKITVGSTDVATGITIGQASTVTTRALSHMITVEPLAITDETLVKIVITTAATTPAAGGISLTPLYVGT